MRNPHQGQQRAGGTCLRPLALALASMLFVAPGAYAAPFDIAQTPLYLGGTLPPNLMYIHDDSGSMYWSFMPDETNYARTTKRAKSSTFNRIYYDPSVTYAPPLDAAGNSLGNASFTGAWWDGYDIANRGSKTTNLSNKFRPTWAYAGGTDEYAGSAEAAYYYVFKPPQTGCALPGDTTDDDCYVKVVVGAAEQQNFANWYSYYRARNYAAKAGISRAFAELGVGIRVGYGQINDAKANDFDGKSLDTLQRGIRPFEDFTSDAVYGNNKFRKDFFDWLFKVQPTGMTPLRRAVNSAGQYYESNNANGPWSTTPGVSGGEILSCRKAFTIVMTDGYWNDASAGTAAATKNVDNTAGSNITGPGGESYTYAPISPFKDSYENTLADIAMYYWKRDLNSAPNRVPVSTLDPAFWQHMTTFGVGLGVASTIDSDTAFAAITNSAAPPITWPKASDHQIDDLLHAAVNGRGGFYSARSPDEFANAMTATLAAINKAVSSAAAVAASSSSLNSDTMLYQAKYDSGDWSGNFLGYKLCVAADVGSVAGCSEVGDVRTNPEWDAADLIPNYSSRSIYTWRPDLPTPAGAPFAWADLSTAQQALLKNDATLLNYVRGDTSQEVSNGGSFRSRGGKKLADILNSDPFYVGTGDFGYATAAALTDAERLAYKTRRATTAYKNRRTMVYVGVNDGMLHAFDAKTGAEKYAYVPDNVIANLPDLADKKYTHEYYVDGSPKAADALVDGAWKTILVGSTGAGGRAYFALDVDSPDSFASSKVKWEFTDADLGMAMGQASIVRTESGNWVAIFGNGYNSDNYTAQLFVVDLATGALVKKIDTKVGTAANPNGLGTPLTVDSDFNGAADLVYAGDMRGNLWKFDLTGDSVASWEIPIGTASEPVPLFNAKDGTGAAALPQPITAKPQVIRHTISGGTMVYFGTGQFFETGAQANMDPQTFYGVIDTCGRNTSDTGCSSYTTYYGTKAKLHRKDLQVQTIDEEYTESFTNAKNGAVTSWDIRVVSQNKVDYPTEMGFYMDLISPPNGKEGERVVSTPVVWDDRVFFVTLIPDADPCAHGVTGWIMELEPFSGGRTNFSVFDLNKDGGYNTGDYDGSGDVVNGRKLPGGMIKVPAVVGGTKYGSSSGGTMTKIGQKESAGKGRQTWHQIR